MATPVTSYHAATARKGRSNIKVVENKVINIFFIGYGRLGINIAFIKSAKFGGHFLSETYKEKQRLFQHSVFSKEIGFLARK
ncbi:hypothetical protein [Vibrio mytili]|uniref:hypothetical protein n=1 Tax=Vibrio mytili TaxID=50718 RepID=UPI0013E2AD84|nr:hypothetical protein [Vibrio mytili]